MRESFGSPTRHLFSKFYLMNKSLSFILMLLSQLSFGSPVPLEDIPGINLPGVWLEMTKEELVTARPQARSISISGTLEQLGEVVPNGPTYLFELRAGKLVHALASPVRVNSSQQFLNTSSVFTAFRTRFGDPSKTTFGRLRKGAAYQVTGAHFDLGGEFDETKALIEGNEVAVRVSVYKTNLEVPIELMVPFAQVANQAQRRALPNATPAPAIRDFINELLP